MKYRWTACILIGMFCLSACSGVEMLPAPISTVASATSIPAVQGTPTEIIDATRQPTIEEGVMRTPSTSNPGQSSTRPSDPQPGDQKLIKGQLFVDSAQVQQLDSDPARIVISLTGNLPTPCHQIRMQANDPDQKNRIQVSVYSVTQPDIICTQVIKPFETGLQLGPYPSGKYTVLVNGGEVGEFQVP
jgi:hypothetical protein